MAGTEAVATEEAAADAVALASAASGRRVILGLAGPPGAGKSTLARAIVGYAQELAGDKWAAYVPMDGYHLSNAQLKRIGLENRKGAPATFDVDGYAAMLARLAADRGTDVYVPDYDRRLHEPVAARLLVPAPARLVVTEGNYLALDDSCWRAARRHIDQLWYVEAPDALRAERLIARQVAGGRDAQAARQWVERSDYLNGELVKRSKPGADRTVIVASALEAARALGRAFSHDDASRVVLAVGDLESGESAQRQDSHQDRVHGALDVPLVGVGVIGQFRVGEPGRPGHENAVVSHVGGDMVAAALAVGVVPMESRNLQRLVDAGDQRCPPARAAGDVLLYLRDEAVELRIPGPPQPAVPPWRCGFGLEVILIAREQERVSHGA
jgi:pantothenate kinase